jgi:hypothetical protein
MEDRETLSIEFEQKTTVAETVVADPSRAREKMAAVSSISTV